MTVPMSFYGPDLTRTWSTYKLAALIERHISVSLRPDGSDPSVGLVADAGIGRFGQAWIEFYDGSSVTWDRNDTPATIIVQEA